MKPMEPLERRFLLALVPLGGETGVTTPAPARRVDVAVAADGSYLLVAADASAEATGNGRRTISAYRHDASGARLGSRIELFSSDSTAEVDVSASVDADGDAVVAWSVWSNTDFQSDPGDFAVYFTRISKAGVVSSPVQLDTLGAPNSDVRLFSPSVSMDPTGQFFVAWIEDVDRDSHDVHFRAFDAAGAPRAAGFTVTQSSPYSFVGGLDLAAKPDGSGAVFSNSFSHSDGLANEARFGQVDLDSLVGEIGTAFTTSRGDTSLVTLAGGGFAVAAELLGPGPNGGSSATSVTTTSVKRFSAAGQQLGDAIQIGGSLATGSKGIATAQLDDLPDGGFVATFVQAVRNGDDGHTATNTIYVSRYTTAGALTPEGNVVIDSVQSPAADDPETPGEWNAAIIEALPSYAVAAGGGRVVAAHVEHGAATYQRLLLDDAEFALLENGVLYVVGSAGDDAITVTQDGTNLTVTRNGETRSVAALPLPVLDVNAAGGNDTITVDSAARSTLRGGEGDDTIFGGIGEDRVLGGIGRDSLWGRDGADKLFGEDGVDSLYGNGGNDRLEGGAQGDHMRGTGGRDMMLGNGGNDRMFGGASGDRMYGQAGNDQIWGEGGNDRLYGDDGFSDTLRGGAGDDVFITLDNVIDQLFGDGGRDSVTGDESDSLTSVEIVK